MVLRNVTRYPWSSAAAGWLLGRDRRTISVMRARCPPLSMISDGQLMIIKMNAGSKGRGSQARNAVIAPPCPMIIIIILDLVSVFRARLDLPRAIPAVSSMQPCKRLHSRLPTISDAGKRPPRNPTGPCRRDGRGRAGDRSGHARYHIIHSFIASHLRTRCRPRPHRKQPPGK